MAKRPHLLIAAGLAVPETALAGGLPQLDTHWFHNQIFWLGVSFSLLYLVVSRLAVPRFTQILGTRKQAIEQALQAAESARASAQRDAQESAQESQQARDAASDAIARAVSETSAQMHARLEAVNHEMIVKAEQAAERIRDAKTKALDSLGAPTAALAAAMVARLVGHTPSAQQAEAAVTKILKESS